MSHMLFIRRFFHSANESVTVLKNGRLVKISSGGLFKMADGEALSQVGNTVVTATAVTGRTPTQSSFLPLMVGFNKHGSALGVIPGNYRRRELTSDADILTGRLIDRSIRPLFPANYRQETEVVCDVRAFDRSNHPDIVGINAASAALALSPCPWNGPVGAVRVGLLEGEAVVNPTMEEMEHSDLNMVVTSTHDGKIVMLEAGGNNVLQQDFLMAVKQGQKEGQKIAKAIQDLQASHGKPKLEVPDTSVPQELVEAAYTLGESKFKTVLTDYSYDKYARDKALTEVRESVSQELKESHPDVESPHINEAVNAVFKKVFRSLILENSVRCDGRGLKDLRNISCSVDLNEVLHGSALFTRGQTSVLCTLTLDSLDRAFKSDHMSFLSEGIKEKNFILHYNFPGAATNEVQSRDRGRSRREVGHGALAERALLPVLPSTFPFVIRLESDVVMSNGSSSMATVCGGSLALMEAGVPISAPVAGVAMGLVAQSPDSFEEGQYQILTDILGIEDYVGDMDFKIAGTKKGITALQMDLKLPGIPIRLVSEAIQQATDAKSKILNIMAETISDPRPERKDNWPATCQLTIPTVQRSKLFANGGLKIKKVMEKTGAEINQLDELTYSLFAPSQILLEDAKSMIEEILTQEKEPELVNFAIYAARITEIRDHGVMVILHPTMRPVLIHNTQLASRRISHPSALGLTVGQELHVQYLGRDSVSGEMRLSRKGFSGLPSDISAGTVVSGRSTLDHFKRSRKTQE